MKELWPLHASDFAGDEAIWFHKEIRKTGRDEVAFTSDYLTGILSLHGNVPHVLNENGGVKVTSPPIKFWPLISDSSPNTSIGGGIEYGARIIHIDNGQFANGWNLVFQDGIDSSASVGGWLGYPSMEIHTAHPGAGRTVFSRKQGDTSLVVGTLLVIIGQQEWGVDCWGTKAIPGSSIQTRLHTNNEFVIKHRIDMNGRPVTASTRGVILEGDYTTGWRRRVLVGE